MSTIAIEPAAARAPPAGSPPPLTRDYISFSAIRSYQQCPLRFFFKYVAGLPEDSVSASLLFGSAIHHAVEHHFRRLLEGEAAPSFEDLFTQYREGWQDHVTPIRFGKDESDGSFDALANRMLRAFSASHIARPSGRILAVEETLRGGIIPGLPDVLGRVDLILETPDELVISDWKSAPDVSVLAQQ